MRSLLRLFSKTDPRATAGGAVMVEFLIAYMPVLVSFLMFWQVGELLVAQMVVERASSAAGRAAVVVVPDDPAFYGAEPQDSYDGERKREVRLAAGMMLAASPHLSENFTVDVQNIPSGGTDVEELTVEVDAEFRCNRLKWVCGTDGVTILKSTTQATYQGANYQYEATDLSNLNTNSNSSSNEPGCTDTDTPNSGGSGNHGGSGHGGVPGKGGTTGKGGSGGKNNGGNGGKADPSGSCPPGYTENKDGSCSKSRGSGLCGPDEVQTATGTCEPKTQCPPGAKPGSSSQCPADVCPTGQTKDPQTKQCKRKRCKNDDGAPATKKPKKDKLPPGYIATAECPGDTVETMMGNNKLCCEQKPNTNGECEQDYDCKCEIANNAPGHSIQGGFTTKNGQSISFGDKAPDGSFGGLFPGECGDSDKCVASPSGTVQKTGTQIVDDYRIKQFNAMCGTTYVKDSLLNNKKTQYNKLSADAKKVWEATNAYCNAVQTQIDANGGTAVGIMLSGSLLATEKNLVDLWNTTDGMSDADKKVFKDQWGTGSNAGHTEPKAIGLIRAWAEEDGKGDPKAFLKGGTFTISPNAGGTASPCDKCDNDLAAFAKEYDLTIKYTFTSVYGTGLRAKNDDAKKAWFWSPSGTCTDPKPGNSLALDGTITYAPGSGNRTFSKPAYPICCK